METNCQLFRPYEYWHILNGTLPASDNAAPLRSLSAALRQVGGPRNDVAFPTGFSLLYTLRVVLTTGAHMWEVVRSVAFTSWKPLRNQ